MTPPLVNTVAGAVSVDDLGLVLTHEHLFIDLVREFRGIGLLHEVDLLTEEVRRFAAAGGGTIVDCTSVGIGRDPMKLREVAAATGVHIVMGCGYYRDPFLDEQWIDANDADAIAVQLIREIEHGVGDTGIRPGIIGEVGCNRDYLSAREERSLRAAARASRATGLPITTHAARWEVGHIQLDVFEHEGVDPGSVIIGHCDLLQQDGKRYHLELARRGAYVQFDTLAHALGEYDLDQRVGYVTNMIDAGHTDRILLSHDVCLRTHLAAFGGTGFSFIADDFRRRLLAAGVTPDEFHAITVANPARALTPGVTSP